MAVDERPQWLEALAARLSPDAYRGLEALHAELHARARLGGELTQALAGATRCGTFHLEEQLAVTGDGSPGDVVRALAKALAAYAGAAT